MRLGLFHAVVATCAFALVLVPSAGASHSFSDVPDSHPFHTEIGVFKDTNITAGCSPTTYCPDDFLRRQGMAAFITRALGLVVRPNESTQKGVPGSRVEMIDDDVSFVGTNAGALELSYNGERGLRLEDPGSFPNVIGGDSSNAVTPGVLGATIAGGRENVVTDHDGAVGGGFGIQVGDAAGSLSDASFATVAGGLGNAATGTTSVVAGGSINHASGTSATVAGGDGNVAGGLSAMVGGGESNTASGDHAVVPGGFLNEASGSLSFAAGNRAQADDQGAFVWGDSQSSDSFSPGVDTFSVRAGGGIWLGTTGTPDIPEGRFLNTSTGAHLTSGGMWVNNSDRALKTDFAEVDGRAILRALALMPIQSWSYKAEPGVRHVGAVAQDFKRAFGLGRGDRHIATVDAEGVALAAIQALYRENRALTQQNRALARENRAQDARLAKLERTVARLTRAHD